MSSSVARSPSPGPAARPFCGLRRSADSSPLRSITSTIDSPQRSASVGKNSCGGGGGRASSRASWSEKENDTQQQRDATRTPKFSRYSTGGGGVAKSFMAPTFSAASKAVAASASPRKKVLGERNNDPPHPVLSSPGDHLAHGKPKGPPPELTPRTEESLGASRRLRLSLDGAPAPASPLAAAPVASLGGEEGEGEEEVENPVCKVHQHHHVSGDAAAPYDPKTNYLSPRPQFLRYRPNPRVEQYRRSGGGSVRHLEDGFASSESSEEADTANTTEEEDLSEEEQESSPLTPESDANADPVAAAVLPTEPAPVSPPPRAPTPKPEQPTKTSLLVGAPAPEPEPAATPGRARAKEKKRSSLRLLLVAPLALVLLMVASFVCLPPSPGSPVALNVSDYFLSVQELHPVELAAWLKQWSRSSLDFVTSYWNALASSREPELFGPHIAANLTAAAADDADHGVGFYYSAAEIRPMPTEELTSASIFEQELKIQEAVSASDTVAIAESEVQEMTSFEVAVASDEPTDDAEMVQESVSATSNVIEELNDSSDGLLLEEVLNAELSEVQEMTSLDVAVEDEPTDDAEMVQESISATSNVMEELNDSSDGLVVEEVLNAEMSEEVSDSSGEYMESFYRDLDIPSQSEPEPEHTVDDMDVPSLQQNVQTDESEGDQKEAHVKKEQETHYSQKLESGMWSGYLKKFSKPAVAGSVLAVLIVSAALAFLHMRQNHARVSLSTNEPGEQEEQVENRFGSGSSEGHTLAKDPVVEETEKTGGSGASQYSSSLSSGLDWRRKNLGEQSLQSLEPMPRRESTGYSTSSYGSFTTYEKISAKKKNKEDEAMTPVRRSSRLRNQVRSPEA